MVNILESTLCNVDRSQIRSLFVFEGRGCGEITYLSLDMLSNAYSQACITKPVKET